MELSLWLRLKLLLSIGGAIKPEKGVPAQSMGISHLRIELQRLRSGRKHVAIAPGGICHRSFRAECPRIQRVELNRAINRGEGFRRTAGARAIKRIEDSDVGVAPTELIGPVEERPRPGQIEAAGKKRKA